MPLFRRAVAIFVAAIVALAVPGIAAAGVPVHFLGDHLVRVRLLPESGTVTRGGSTWLAVELTPSPGWHIYWRNPGDSGQPPRIAWMLPRGVSVGATSWPAPERLTTGGITTYVYNRRATLLLPLSVRHGAHARLDAPIAADLSWLVCSNVCVPGRAHASTHLAIAAAAPAIANRRESNLFTSARSHLPREAHFETTFRADRTSFQISVPVTAIAGERVTGASFFPLDGKLIAQSAAQHVTIDDRVTLTLQRNGAQRSTPARIDGVLAIEGTGPDGHRLRSDYAVSANPAVTAEAGVTSNSAITMMPERPLSLIAAFVLAFLGGIVLNVMPCVFPVLSFKALGAIKGSAPNRRWAGAVAYAAGVVASCVTLGLVLLTLRGGGQAIGWGFQWQSPLFVALLAMLLLALALSMSGVAEIVIPLPGPLAHRNGDHGAVSAFTDGALVALIASSCTAPFMGAALGFALTASAPVALGVFVALGLGLALPYVVVTGVPAVAARLPKPGPWMVVARRLFAFPLYASVAWLVWVFSAQVDGNALLALLVALVFVGFGISAFGAAQASEVWRRGWVSFGVAGFVIALVLVLPARAVQHDAGMRATSQGALHFERFTPARLAALRSAGRPVFVDIGAAWCITCQVNDRLALEGADVGNRFRQLHVTLLQGDWTNQDARISEYLQHFGRSGVPLYVYYHANGNIEVWPQLLTPALVLQRLNRG